MQKDRCNKMKNWWKEGNAKRNWGITLALLAVAGLTGLCVFIPAISWHNHGGGMNIAGILFSLAAGCSLVTAIVQPWRRLGKYLVLLVGAILGFFALVWMHNMAYALREMTTNRLLLPGIFDFIDVSTFLLALFLCPCLFLVAAGGAALVSFRQIASAHTRWRKLLLALTGMACLAAMGGFIMFVFTQMA
ncbi:MAG: hypothetical protein JW828_02975 [Sedimentisphaerales bacterium]|nr:hypothetical protein [Sedimentisphaerales bacterium]